MTSNGNTPETGDIATHKERDMNRKLSSRGGHPGTDFLARLQAALALLGIGLGGVYSSDLPDEHEGWLGIG